MTTKVRTFTDVLESVRQSEGTPSRPYWSGALIGFLAAERADEFRDYYLEVVGKSGAAIPGSYEQVAPLVPMLTMVHPHVFLRACGALTGFLWATEHLDDAATCAACDRRIFEDSDDDFVRCQNHGPIHEDDCRRSLCEGNCYLEVA